MKTTSSRSRHFATAGLTLGLALFPAMAAEHEDMEMKKGMGAHPLHSVSELIAVITPVSGSNIKGTVLFEKDGKGVKVTAKVGGFEPGTEHGFHIHDLGNIVAEDGTSAGGHYNPEGHDHALPDTSVRHAGDLGNLKADDDGNAVLTMTVDNVTLAGRKNPIIGRAVVIHANKDDGGQPTGNAGDRIGVGVIGISGLSTAEPVKK